VRPVVGLVIVALLTASSCGGDDDSAEARPSPTIAAPSDAPSTAPPVDETPTAPLATDPGERPPTQPATTSAPPVASPPVACATDGAPAAPTTDPAPPTPVPADAVTLDPTGSFDDALDDVADHADPVIVLADGEHPMLTIRDAGPVTLVGASRDGAVLAGLVLDGAHDITVRGLTVAGNEDPASSAILVTGGSSRITLSDLTVDPAHNAGVDIVDGAADVVVERSLITGVHVTRKMGQARNVHIGEGSPDPGRWVTGIEVRDNELVGAGADAIQVAGARDVTIAGNFIHDVQQNDDHNDGIQIVAVDGAVIDGNTLTSLTATSQDQSILLGHLGGGAGPAADPNLKVRDVLVTNNLVSHWRGAGITLSGTIDVTVSFNTSVDNGRDGTPFPGLLVDATHAPNDGLRLIGNIVSDIARQGDAAVAEQSGNVVVTGVGASAADITADPCFADRTDYRLAPQSPAVDLGDPAAAPAVDRTGRPRDGRPDAGATELG
jgi:hypothetical protein